jgi:signal transduction histidine kinase
MVVELLKVLLIEDNPGDVRLIKEMLVDASNTSFSLDHADRLSKGLALLAESEIDVVLLDLSLPDSKGLDTFVSLHTAAKDVPIVVLSGLNDETAAVQCVNAGAQDYLIKGEVGSHLLIRSLRYAVARGELERERSQLLLREQAARAQAEAASRAKDEFLAIISHELRTPLSSIIGWSRLLLSGKLDPISANRGMEAIERNARLQTQLIEDLLDVSRITTGKLHVKARPLELASVLRDTIQTMKPAAEAKDIALHTALDENAGFISGDRDRLQQVAWNLLSNAIKFTPAGGQINIRLERVGSNVEITVADTGSGINPEFLPYVFERFRQADSSTTRQYGGLGLGLSIVRYLVEMHGGIVQVESPGEGQGSTFRVMFPLFTEGKKIVSIETADAKSEKNIAVEGEPSLNGVRVLVVEDQADFREVITQMLLQAGAEVLTVSSAAEALESLDLWRPDVLLADIEMPHEDGYSLLHKIRERDRQHGGQIPAAALTAYGRPEDRVRVLEAGYQTFLPKPIDPRELAIVVAKLAKNHTPEN